MRWRACSCARRCWSCAVRAAGGADGVAARLRRGRGVAVPAGRPERSDANVIGDLLAREEVVRQAGAVDAVRGRRRRAGQLARSGRGRVAARLSRSRRAPPAAVRPAPRATLHTRPAHARRRQAVHPLGQDRHRHADRPLRAARFPQRRRHRVSGGHRRPRGRCRPARDTFEVVVGAALHAQPHAAARSAMDGRSAGRPRRPMLVDGGRRLPEGPQAGVRWAHIGRRLRVLALVLRRVQPSAEHRGGAGAERAPAVAI